MAAGNRKKHLEFTFARKDVCLPLWIFECFFLLKLKLFRMLKITRRVIFKIRKSSVTAVLLMSRTMETRKLKLFYFQKKARHRTKKLWTDIFLCNLSLNEGKYFVGLPVLNSRIWWRHIKTKNLKKIPPYARERTCVNDQDRREEIEIFLLPFQSGVQILNVCHGIYPRGLHLRNKALTTKR